MGLDIDSIKFDDEHVRKKFATSKSLSSIYRAMQAAELHKNFEVGQVLVCLHKNTGKFLTNKAGATQKWIVANKMGGSLCLCRKLGINGRPGKGIDIIAEYDPNHYIFQEDPDVADAIILGIDYDPFKMPKLIGKARDRARRYNNNIRFADFLKEKLGSNVYQELKVLSLVEELIMQSTNQKYTLWRMTDENNKHRVELISIAYGVSSLNGQINANIIESGGVKHLSISPWELRNTYSIQYFIEEPKTIKEEMNK